MKLLKIGNTTINVKRVLRFDDDGAAISVSFLAPDSPEFPVNARFEGEQAEALRAWIARQAKDVMTAAKAEKPKKAALPAQPTDDPGPQPEHAQQDNGDVEGS